ncbi:efflux RND transporter periplasmic adaptor subunit, partial [Patescibacteria group bacterium]|nr:efflux RND transporter periplasmic adaptor subunit [Patescibacteria group bacterium]
MASIKTIKTNTLSWWKVRSTRTKIGIVTVTAVVVFGLLSMGKDTSENTLETAKRVDVVRTVNASGTVVSSTDLALSFESNKVIDSVKVRVGDEVKKGQILATMKSSTERASYTSARGAYLAAQARYKKVLDGNSNEEIALAQVNLDTTKKVQEGLVTQARRKLFSDGLIAESQDSSINQPIITSVFNGVNEGEYRIGFKNSAKSEVSFNGIEKGEAEVSEFSKRFGTLGLQISFPLDKTEYSASQRWTVSIPNKDGVNYSSNLNAYLSAVQARDAAIAQREAELALKRATARQADVDAALADIVIAQASLESANAALEKTILRAPADGTITQVNIKVGAVPQPAETAIILQDVSNLYLEANVNESYVGQLMVGQNVSVTFDALSGTTYRGTVSSVDPAATVTDNIVNYKVKALLVATENILPGMTADMAITTGSVNGVVTLPGRVITERDNAHYVDVVVDARRNKTEERMITLGLRGDGDIVEV